MMDIVELARKAGKTMEANEKIDRVGIARHPDEPEQVIIRMVLHKQEGWKDNLVLRNIADRALLENPEVLTDYLIGQAEFMANEGLVERTADSVFLI